MATRKPYKPRIDYTMEDVIEIKKENKRKLDEILSKPDWMEWLGRKYYGDEYLKTFPAQHYKKVEYNKKKISGEIKSVGMSDAVERRYYKTPIIEIDKDGSETEWPSVMDFCDANGKKKTAAYKILLMMDGRLEAKTLYKKQFKWKK